MTAQVGPAKGPKALRIIGDAGVEFREPDVGCGIAWRAPVAARRQRAARSDLWPIGYGRALELADLEETKEEQAQPALDGGEVVGLLDTLGHAGWPVAGRGVAPGIPGEVGDLGRREAVAGQVEQVEVLQRVGADHLLGALRRFVAVTGDELRRNLGRQHRAQRFRSGAAELLALGDP